MDRNKIGTRRPAIVGLVFSLLVVAAVAGLVMSGRLSWRGFGKSGGGSLFPVSRGAPLVHGGSLTEGFRPVVKKTLPAVVNISTTTIVRTSPLFSDPLFREFFEGFGLPERRRVTSLGSGVIVNPDGYIVTNSHVVQGASEIVVSTTDKKELKARVVGSDAKTDLALLKVSEKNLPFLTLGDSSTLDVGDIVLAIGNPFGIGQTVTMGIVSALGRAIGIEQYEDFIQTDAAINPGNSGGALVNLRGELVGINTAIASRSGGNVGVGFAIPSNLVQKVAPQLLKSGGVVRGWLGVTIQPVGPKEAKALGLQRAQGALISQVQPGSPAERAGLAPGDVILSIDGKRVEDSRDVQFRIAAIAPGTKVKLGIFRDGRELEMVATLAEMPDDLRSGRMEGAPGSGLDGVDVEELTPELVRQLGLGRQTTGVVVTYVDPSSAAAEAGLSRGDVIQEVNRIRVKNVASFERVLKQAGNKPILLLVNRRGTTQYVVVEPR